MHTHLLCAAASGFNAVIVGSPVDVIKTRMMNKAVGQPDGLFGIIAWTMRNEGPGAFYKGFQANFARLACWNAAMFVTLEQIKKQFV